MKAQMQTTNPLQSTWKWVACQKRFRDLLTTRSKILDSFKRTRIPTPTPTPAPRPTHTPSPTPFPTPTPEEKELTLHINPDHWPINESAIRRKHGDQYELRLKSAPPDILPSQTIHDTAGRRWTLTAINVEEIRNKDNNNITTFWLTINTKNNHPAAFTGYSADLWKTEQNRMVGTSPWKPLPLDKSTPGHYAFEVRIPTEMQGQLFLRIWDNTDPVLQSKQLP